jgi:hypothetical protein
MRKSLSNIALAGALMMLLGATIGASRARAGETTANDCLIAIEDGQGFVSSGKKSVLTCTDGAACDSDGATDGKCTVKVQACVKLAGCAARPLDLNLKKTKVSPKKLAFVIPSSACGSFVDIVLAKDKGKKSKKTLTAKAVTTEKPAKKNTDIDKVQVVCAKCTDPSGSCVPPTTTTSVTVTTTTTSTSTTTNPCGNGVIDNGETCDPDAVPNGCSGGTPFCNPDTCASCQANCSQLAFTTGLPTIACSFPGGGDHGQPPYTGFVNGDPEGLGHCVSTKCNNGSAGNPGPTGSTGDCTVDADCNACKSNLCDNGSLGTGNSACTTNSDCTKLYDLGAGCLYIGGGLASSVPPGPTPDGSTTIFGVQDCSGNNLTLTALQTGSPRTCTVGPSASSKHCANGSPGTDGQSACTQDADCLTTCVDNSNAACNQPNGCHCNNGAPGLPGKDRGTCSVQGTCGGTSGTCSLDPASQCGCDLDCNGACSQDSHCGNASAGVCQPDPSCFFGNPLPIENSGLSTCVLNVVDDGASGTADKAAGSSSTQLPLKSWVYLTGVEVEDFGSGHPCPICQPDNTCNAGPRKGLPCHTDSSLLVTHDCPPPPHLFLAPLGVVLGPLTTATATSSDSGGVFCNPQQDAGAFGVAGVTFTETGSAAVGGLDVTAKAATLASVFCIPATNNILIDASANLPGPGAIGLPGEVRLR